MFDGLVVYKKGVQVRAVLDLHGSLVWRINDGIYRVEQFKLRYFACKSGTVLGLHSRSLLILCKDVELVGHCVPGLGRGRNGGTGEA